ncbi:hypothetical protein [Streptomyces sp. NRRL F-5727]|uniref:hypothetical protein n=1 Tax=Streptomyces sp. NRRL F-5727 TaxID=1463871 RepID=UPI0004C87B6C|nr:hypothetical protein [Streptomyces sp. NRRL F-5727]
MNNSSGGLNSACPDDDYAWAFSPESGRDHSAFGLYASTLPHGAPRKDLVDMTGETLEYLDMMSDHALVIDEPDPDHRDDG